MRTISRRTMLQTLAAHALAVGVARGQTVRHQTPKPLSPDAVTHGWPSFLGPTHNAVSSETHLSRDLPPPLVWEFEKGTGYTSPAIVGDRLMFFHRIDDREVVECLHAETGEPRWQFRYATAYRDRYGYNNGPRSSPVIDQERVFTLGAEGKLHCFELATGEGIWSRDLRAEYDVRQDFFGTASTPLAENGLLIVMVGAPGGPTVVAFDQATGREVWRAGEWGPSYASPVPATLHGERRVLVFAGGESTPPIGGLLSIDPDNGEVDFAFPFRSRTYESVNASCPVVFDDTVFISASYRTGGALVRALPDFTHEVVWTTQDFALHFNTPIHRDGYLYGFDGRNQGDASLACIDAADGTVVWREAPQWTETFEQGGRQRQAIVGTARGSLLAADGEFLALGELGHLLWLDLTPDGYREVSRTWLTAAQESWTLPVLSRGLLYVMQNTRDILTGASPRLLCYDLRA
ncbi:MAG: PQQ-like beta-propeller repeat protein [Vicinamibacterales bacterium]|jgi:outer membrane protein assembly factor BamB|nr:PQQ-like beta-propeller repeat protein [Vicinamibacterales bacterium]MDP7692423.1 PQQ-like beta-propeller repeat protein [Vicinamibacterales bacterium]HJN43294.1 PQQ-binding-like beta-propeller repeat protein [Vicinamibacterales bacterium]